jgi:ATP-dependent DNA helicase RecG
MGLRKNKLKKEPGIAFEIKQNKLEEFIGSLPFTLTGSQKKVLEEILNDMQNPQPMNRLLQGDVGSGKTIIATLAAYVAITNGYQSALMAPTEILAQQHYLKLFKFTEKLGLKIVLLTSTTSKKVAQHELEEADLMIGTHALIEKKVKFRRLGLVIIDEQHRFGVLQRANLVQKGITPDVLVMTATPIPRSLALTVYGDLDRSIINELPPGRTPIKTHFVPEAKRKSAYEFMRQKINEGRQVFIVCPLVEESEELDLKAAKEEADYLQKEVFPELKVGLMHGRMTGEEKDQIMGKFRDQKIAILVSTTVIEVGIDIPNATVMVIEHAERFGLAQLHQLRGRIGRGAEQSYCFLMADPKSPEAKARIKAMLDTNDGFKIAEVDLRLRGPGEFYGTRQSGLPNFRVADIIRDDKLLQEARVAALDLIATDQESARNIWQSQREKIKGTFSGATLN